MENIREIAITIAREMDEVDTVEEEIRILQKTAKENNINPVTLHYEVEDVRRKGEHY